MHYFYLTVLVLSTTNTYVINLKETVLSILDPAKNTTEKIKILQDLSKYLQVKEEKNAKDNEPEICNITRNMSFTKFTVNTERSVGTRRFFNVIPVFNKFNPKRKCEKSSSSSDGNLKCPTESLVRKFVPISFTQPQGDDVKVAVPKPWGFKCHGPRQQDMHWGTCTLPEKCNEENRLYLGDNFCNKTAYICCTHTGATKYPNLVNALKHENNRFTDTEYENEADARDNREAAFIRRKLRRVKQINFMLSPSLSKRSMGEGLQPKEEKIKDRPESENLKNTGYGLEIGRVFIIRKPFSLDPVI